MLSKEDQLLEKLQKCVGRLEGRPSTATDRYPPREQPRYPAVEASHQKPVREKRYDVPGSGLEKRRDSLNASADFGVANWGNNQENYAPQPPRSRNSASKNYLTERRFNSNLEIPVQVQLEGLVGDIRKKYEQPQKNTTYEAAKRTKNYLQNSESTRKPLRQYDYNSSVNEHSAAKNIRDEKKALRSFVPEQKICTRKYQIESPKYEQYKPALEKIDIYRRNSNSYQEGPSRTYRQDNIRNSIENAGSNSKSSLSSAYKSRDMSDLPPRQSQPVPQYAYPYPRDRSAHKENAHSSPLSQSIAAQAKRQTGIGSISSMSKRPVPSLESSKLSYETFQPKQPAEPNLQQILHDVGSANQDTFTKLQKISELNDRINMRIRAIIDNFQTK